MSSGFCSDVRIMQLVKLGQLIVAFLGAGSLVLLGCAVMLGKRTDPGYSYLALAAKGSSQIDEFIGISKLSDRLQIAREDSEFGRAYLQYLHNEGRLCGAPPAVLIRSNDPAQPITNPTQISSILNRLRRGLLSESLFPYLLASTAGVLFGLALMKWHAAWYRVAAAIGLWACVVKATATCAICVSPNVSGVGIEYYAAAVYILLVLSPPALGGPASAVVGTIGLLVQQFLLANYAIGLCGACLTVGSVNAALFVGGLGCWGRASSGPSFVLPRRYATALAGTLALCTVIEAKVAPLDDALRDLSGTRPACIGWIGRDVSELGFDAKGTSLPALLVFGTPTCPACIALQSDISNAPLPVPYRWVTVTPSSTPPTPTSIPYRSSLGGMPFVALVGSNGKVLDELHGWSSDPRFKVAVWKRLRAAVANNPRQGLASSLANQKGGHTRD